MSIKYYPDAAVLLPGRWREWDLNGTLQKDTDSSSNAITHAYFKDDPIISNHHAPTDYTHGQWTLGVNDWVFDNTNGYGTRTLLEFSDVGNFNNFKSYGPAGHTISIINANLLNRAKVECLAKLGSDKIDLGVTIGESVQSARGVVSLATDVLKAAVAIKRGSAKELRRIFGEEPVGTSISSRWLQYQLGVKPMVNDLYAAAELFDKGIQDRTTEGRAMGIKATRNVTHQWSDADSVSLTQSGHLKYNVVIRALINDISSHGYAKLGLNNPNGVIWELTPFSWLIDYMVPIGTMLQAMNASVGLTFDGAWTSYNVYEKVTMHIQHTLGSQEIGELSHVTSYLDAFHRITMTGFPAVVPYVKNPFTTTHSLNAIALYTVLSNRKK